MKRILTMFLAVCLLFAGMLAVNVGADELATVYLSSESGSDTNDGSAADKPVATLAKAYEILGENGGTIVLMSDLEVKANKSGTTSEFSATAGSVCITGKDPATQQAYDPTIKVVDANSSDTAYVAFFTPTAFSDICFDRQTNKTLYFLTGPSLTFGDGMSFTYNGSLLTDTEKDVIGVRLGSHSAEMSAAYVQKSGTIGSVCGGNTEKKIEDADTSKSLSSITICGTTKVLVRLEGCANGKYLRNSQIQISDSAEVSTLCLGGYNANVGTSTVTISGGKVGSISSSRSTDSAKGKTVGDTSLTISGSAEVGAISLNSRHDGTTTNTLVIQNDQTITADLGAYWDSITISAGATVTLNAAYTASDDASLTVDGTLVLSRDVSSNDEALVTKLNAANKASDASALTHIKLSDLPQEAAPTVVYVGGEKADAGNDGKTADTAVATLEQAYQVLNNEGGTIILCGDVSVSSTDGTTTPFAAKKAHIKGQTGTEKLIVTGVKNQAVLVIQSATEISDLTMDWNCGDTVGLYIFSGPSLTFGENVTFTKQGQLLENLSDGVTKDYISIRMGAFSDSACKDAVYIQKSGALSAVYAGNNKTALDSSKIQITDNAQVLVRLQGGATDGNVEKVTINVQDNAQVAQLAIGGHTKKTYYVKSSDIHISGGTIGSIIGARTDSFQVGDVALSIGGTAQVSDITWSAGTKTGSAYTLTFEQDLADDLVLTSLGDFWTSIKVEEGVKLHLDGTYDYTAMANTLTMCDDSILYIDAQKNSTDPVSGTHYQTAGTKNNGKVLRDVQDGHTLTHVEARCAGSGEAYGNMEYWYCETCDNCYADAEGKQPLSHEATKTLGGHMLVKAKPVCSEYSGSVTYYVCENCGGYFADAKAQTAVSKSDFETATKHNPVFVSKTAPTCTEDGIRYDHYHCQDCNWNFEDAACTKVYTHSVVEPKTGHDFYLVEAKNATCTAEGNTSYYACTKCDKVYRTGVIRLEIAKELTAVKITHALKHVAAKAASCVENGNIEYWYCDEDGCGNCGKYYTDAAGTQQTTKEAVVTYGHQLTHVKAVPATCTEAGTVEHYTCALCQKNFQDKDARTELTSITVNAAGHTLTHVAQVASTTEKTGTKEHWICSDCGKVFSDAKGENEVTDLNTLVIEKKAAGANTGETVLILPVIVLMLLSASGVAVIAVIRKRGKV